MKKISLLSLATFISFLSFGQNFIEKNYAHFLEREDITAVHVSGKMFEMITKLDIETEDEELNEAIEMIEKIESFDLIMVPELVDAKKEYNAGFSNVKGYEELVRVRDKEVNFSLHIDEENDVVYEIVGMGAAEGKFFAFSLLGEIDLSQVGRMINKIQEKGLNDVIGDIDLGVEDVKIYPNPATADAKLTVEVSEDFIGGKGKVYDLNGQMLSSFDLESTTQNIDTNGLTEGQYVVELSKGEMSIKKKVIFLR